MTTVLFELGCEELPPKSLKPLQTALYNQVKQLLIEADLAYTHLHAFAAPRRLALLIEGLSTNQPDRVEQKKGPALAAAYDAEGKPSKAAMGFARSLGKDPTDLITLHTDKGDYVGYELRIKGAKTADVLPPLLQKALDGLPIAKRMRSADSRHEFVRPVQWVVLLQDDQVIPASIQGFQTDRKTFGHRFHHPQAIELKHAKDYADALRAAFVEPDFAARQACIVKKVEQLAYEVDACAILPDELVDEVTALVDWPVALRAQFEPRFLKVPQEALISTMQADQKYFCLTKPTGELLPYFVFISNIESKDPKQVVLGNEKVVRPRLADAEFFFNQDQKLGLDNLQDKLKTRVFQEQLGSLSAKTDRMVALAEYIAKAGKDLGVAVSVEEVKQAAFWSKADLTSHLVGEFPDLQGIAGRYYAKHKGMSDTVSDAIADHYLPRFSKDNLPKTPEGVCVALADRLDTLAGIFAIDQAPTGSKDPFALRRAAIAVLRLLIESKLDLDLKPLIEQAVKGLPDTLSIKTDEVTHAVYDFIASRYKAMYTEKGIGIDTLAAVEAIKPATPLEFDQRVCAVEAFKVLPQASALAQNNKRVANILSKAEDSLEAVDPSLFEDAAETQLYQAAQAVAKQVQPLVEAGKFTEVLQALTQLDEPLQTFFTKVMVNTEKAAVRLNRLALLSQVRTLFLLVADVGELSV